MNRFTEDEELTRTATVEVQTDSVNERDDCRARAAEAHHRHVLLKRDPFRDRARTGDSFAVMEKRALEARFHRCGNATPVQRPQVSLH